MGKIFNSLYTSYQETVEANRKKFEDFDNTLKGKHASQIFEVYWELEGQTNAVDGEDQEKIKLTRKSAFNSLPEDLKKIIQ